MPRRASTFPCHAIPSGTSYPHGRRLLPPPFPLCCAGRRLRAPYISAHAIILPFAVSARLFEQASTTRATRTPMGARPAFTRRAVGGECNLIVLDAGDVFHDAFADTRVT
jgi:hypothetical protein